MSCPSISVNVTVVFHFCVSLVTAGLWSGCCGCSVSQLCGGDALVSNTVVASLIKCIKMI